MVCLFTKSPLKSMAASRSTRLCRSLFTKSYTTTTSYNILSSFSYCTDSSSDLETEHVTNSVPDKPDIVLEKGLDFGIYKAILVGKVGQTPVQKILRNGNTVTMLSIGTGGMQYNRTPFENEDPKDYANRCSVQWHRVIIYEEKLGDVAIKPGQARVPRTGKQLSNVQ